jgi:hypothetical protein
MAYSWVETTAGESRSLSTEEALYVGDGIFEEVIERIGENGPRASSAARRRR